MLFKKHHTKKRVGAIHELPLLAFFSYVCAWHSIAYLGFEVLRVISRVINWAY